MGIIKFVHIFTQILVTFVLVYQFPVANGEPSLSFSVEPADTWVAPGGSALLHCALAPGLRGLLRWRTADRHALTFIGDLHRSQLVNGSLLVSNVVRGRGLEGGYQCVAELAPPTGGLLASRTARLTVGPAPSSAPDSAPREVNALVGQRAYLPCDKRAGVRVWWVRDGRPMRLDVARMTVLPSGALEIDDLRAADAAVYRCNASGTLGPRSRLAVGDDLEELARLTAPTFIAEPAPAVASRGETVTLECAGNGNPSPWVLWLKDGAAIDMADLDSRFTKVGSGSLQIRDVQEADRGTYQCRANNREDSVDASATLTVQVSPVFERRPTDAVVAEKSDVEFACSVTGRPEPRVQWTKDGDLITHNEYLQVVNGQSLRILGVMAQDAGVFQCVAENAAGNEQSAARLTVLPTGATGDRRAAGDKVGVSLPAVTPPPLDNPSLLGPAPGSSGTPPAAPTALTALMVASRFVILGWDWPDELEEATPPAAFSVYYRQQGSQRERVLNASGTQPQEANIGGLAPSKTYLFRVVAISETGLASPPSNVLQVETKEEAQVPGAPRDVRATPTGATSVAVEWLAPEESSGPVQRYRMFYVESDSGTEQHLDTSSLGAELTDLAAFTEYVVWVAAFNQNGPGAASAEVPVRTWSDVPSSPPQNVSLETGSSTSIIVRWQPPSKEACNGVITGYKVRYRKKDRRPRGDAVTAAGNRRLYALTGLDRHSTYQVRIAALTVNGTGPATDWLTADTYENDLDETRVPDSPGSLKVRPMSTSIAVSWAAPRASDVMVRGYTIGWGKWVPDVYTQVLDEKTRFYMLENLEPNSEYIISLRAYNEMGDGRPTYETVRTREESAPEPAAPLIPPVGLTADVLSATTVFFSWADALLPKTQRVSDERRYEVRYTSSHHAASPRYRLLNATKPSIMIDQLRPNTQYEFTVRLVKGRRESPWSMVVLNMTQEAAPASQPRDLTVVPIQDNPNAVNMNWQPPKQPNGPITGYVILYTKDGSQSDRDWAVEGVVGDRMTATVKGLDADATYHFKVQARNRKGYGPSSPVVTFTTGPSNGVAAFNPGQTLRGDGSDARWPAMAYIVCGCVLVVLVSALVVGAVVVCCRRKSSETAKKGYAKGKPGKAALKQPPDLWIHHDQMELKALEKSGGSGGDGPPSHTLPRPGTLPSDSDDKFRSGSLDKRTYVSSYIALPTEERNATLRRSLKLRPQEDVQHRSSISSAGGLSSGSGSTSTEPRPMYPRTQYTISRAQLTLDQQGTSPGSENPYSLQGGYDTVVSLPAATMGTPLHPSNAHASPYSSGGGTLISEGGSAKRLQGHPLKSFTVPAPPPQSAPSTPPQKHIVRAAQGSSPYRKPAQGGTPVKRASAGPASADETQRLQPSYSTEELNQEMANLEGLMKDLNAITASEFEC